MFPTNGIIPIHAGPSVILRDSEGSLLPDMDNFHRADPQ
jgi:hypothetical protein